MFCTTRTPGRARSERRAAPSHARTRRDGQHRKVAPAGDAGRHLRPGALPAMYAGMARSVALQQRSGTVAVSAAGMFGGGGGFGITPLALFSLAVVVPEPDGHRFLVEEPAAAAT